jgi:hypothetical protein
MRDQGAKYVESSLPSDQGEATAPKQLVAKLQHEEWSKVSVSSNHRCAHTRLSRPWTSPRSEPRSKQVNIEHIPASSRNLPVARTTRAAERRSRTASRSLAVANFQTMMRVTAVQSEGIVQSEKMREIDRVTQTAMTGQALLSKWRDTLAGADPMLQDELKFFTDVARLGKGEIVMDTVASLRQK